MAEPTDPTPDAGNKPDHPEITLHAETLGHDMLQAMLDELKAAPDCWQKMSQRQQDEVIHRLDTRVASIITTALRLIIRGENPAASAVVESVTFKDGVKVALKLSKLADARHELADAEGRAVVVVIADPQDYFGRMNEIKGEADQKSLDLDGDDHPPASGSEDPTPPDPDAPAPEPPAGLELERDPIWKQAIDSLAKVGVVVEEETAKTWTDDQLTEAAYWSTLVQEKGRKAPPPPKFITLPHGWKPPKSTG